MGHDKGAREGKSQGQARGYGSLPEGEPNDMGKAL